MSQSILRKDALVTGIIDNEFYIVSTSTAYPEDIFVLTYKDGGITFDRGWYQNDNVLTLRFCHYGDGKGYISTYVNGMELILTYTLIDNTNTLFISAVDIKDIDDSCIIHLNETVMPTDGNGLYSWVPLTFGYPGGEVIITASNSTCKKDGFPSPQSDSSNLKVSGFVSPVPVSWFSKRGDLITEDSLIYNYCFRLNKYGVGSYQCERYTMDGIEGITDFGDGYKTNFTPFYTSRSCGEEWDMVYKDTFDQDIAVKSGRGYGESQSKDEICASIKDEFISVQYPILITTRTDERIKEDSGIVEGYVADNQNDVLDFIGDNIFAFFPNICDYINSGGRCRRNICSQCTENNCPESFRACGPPGTGGAPIWAIWIISILAFAFIVAAVSGIICLIYYNREAREVERLTSTLPVGQGPIS
jgi:hypothetical protein